jgi:hypothetical protein
MSGRWRRMLLVAGALAPGASRVEAQYADSETGGVKFLVGGGLPDSRSASGSTACTTASPGTRMSSSPTT